MEVLISSNLLIHRLDALNNLLVHLTHLDKALSHSLSSLGALQCLVAHNLLEVGALRNMVDSRYDLQLCSTLIDVQDAGITIEALASVVLHIARTTVHLDRVVGNLVSPLRCEHLSKWREAISKAVVVLHLLTLLGIQRALVRDMCELLVDVDPARCLIEQCTRCKHLSLHILEHLANGSKLDNRLTELLALRCVLQRLAVCRLGKTC